MKNLITVAAIFLLLCTPGLSNALTIIDNSTQGFYNDKIGEVLNGTNPIVDDNFVNTFLFPNNNSNPNDPTINAPPEPNLSAASAVLGNWLTDPTNLNSNWIGPQAIPSTWTVNSETAIIYSFDAGSGLQDVTAAFGVDNGLFAWLDGNFIGGQLRPGGASLGELVIDIGDLSQGMHYLQVLREDHGVASGYAVSVTGEIAVPEPSTMFLVGIGILGLVGINRKRSMKL